LRCAAAPLSPLPSPLSPLPSRVSSRERLILRLSLIVRRAFCSSVTESVPKISTLAKMKIGP
jgi:hypothetical protein